MASASSRSCKYDVFLSFRGDDTRKTFVDHLYSGLKQHLIRVYKDDETLLQGESIHLSLFEAIEESRIAVIIFSKNYADSSWCLEELVHIMKCQDERELIVIPVFYNVEPSEVRNRKGDFGEAFYKQEAKNTTKAEIWRKALIDVSNIAGWEPKNIANGHESQFIKKVVNTILDRLFLLNSYVDEDIVGMTTRLQDLKSQLEIVSDCVRMVGIWGGGGTGKTTLATCVYMEISHHFESHCIVENVREESSKYDFKKLQEKILSVVFQREIKVQSVAEGKRMIKTMLCSRNVLLILDDVDNLDQLKALAGSHNWFGRGSRIIITTRDEHLLKTHRVDQVYHVKLLSHDEAIQLFRRHAYNEKDPVEDYETLSLSVVSYAGGLPLALKVLGSFLYDKKKKGWMSTLARLKDIPEMKIVEKLKISYDGLKTVEKELFLDIACFFRGRDIGEAMQILEACDFHPEIGIEVLRQKALISIDVHNRFDMHDLVLEMGHYIVRGEHPNNPEKHSRVWKYTEIKDMSLGDASVGNDKIEAITITNYSNEDSSRYCKIVSNMKKLRWLTVYGHAKNVEGPTLSNELRYIKWAYYPSSSFPDSFQPSKLVVLKLSWSMHKEVWKGCKCLPHLKVLELIIMKELLRTPDFDGLPSLQKLELKQCFELEHIHPSLGHHKSLEYVNISHCYKLRMFPTIVNLENLKALKITHCSMKDGEIPSGIGELSNLRLLNLSANGFSGLEFNLSQLTRLKVLDVSGCVQLLELPELPSSLNYLKANDCMSLTTIGDSKNCKWLHQVSITGRSNISGGDKLLETMLQGKAIEHQSMLLQLESLEIAKGFRPRLLRGRRCGLKLPENSCGDFCGFLMCVVMTEYLKLYDSLWITMNEVVSDMDSIDDVFWEESDIDKYTVVWYVSFDSLRESAWWDPAYKALSFDIKNRKCSGFGVRLVASNCRSGLTETS